MAHQQPFFSIVIPTYARPHQLAECLRAIAGLDYPRDHLEVIVVDDGSETPAEGAIAPFRNQLDLRFLTQSHGGPAKARNTGAALAQGDMLAFTDDDCLPAPEWLRAFAARLVGGPNRIIGGHTVNLLHNNVYSAASQTLADLLCAYFNTDPERAAFFSTSNLAAPAAQFRELGGFDTGFTTAAAEDRDFCDRWLHRGYRMAYAPDAEVYHAHALNLLTFWKQQFSYGRGDYKFYRARNLRGSDPFKPNTRLYLLIFFHAFSSGDKRIQRRVALAVLLCTSQIAVGAGFLWEWLKHTETNSFEK